MTVDEAHEVLRAFAAARPRVDEAVLTLHRAKIPQTHIAELSSLSRDGVRKIIARQIKQPDQARQNGDQP